MASSRRLDCAIASTLAMPSAVSISTSKPMRLLRPLAFSICVTSMSIAYTSAATPAFGIRIMSSRGQASTMSTTSRYM